jgi:hypothetical protein
MLGEPDTFNGYPTAKGFAVSESPSRRDIPWIARGTPRVVHSAEPSTSRRRDE